MTTPVIYVCGRMLSIFLYLSISIFTYCNDILEHNYIHTLCTNSHTAELTPKPLNALSTLSSALAQCCASVDLQLSLSVFDAILQTKRPFFLVISLTEDPYPCSIDKAMDG